MSFRDDPEKRRAYAKAWNARNTERNRVYGRKWRAANREQWLEISRRKQRKRRAERNQVLSEIKLGRGCALCGYREHAIALDFDHLDPSVKGFNIASKAANASWADLMAEVGKCRVLCSNCHRVETVKQRQK